MSFEDKSYNELREILADLKLQYKNGVDTKEASRIYTEIVSINKHLRKADEELSIILSDSGRGNYDPPATISV